MSVVDEADVFGNSVVSGGGASASSSAPGTSHAPRMVRPPQRQAAAPAHATSHKPTSSGRQRPAIAPGVYGLATFRASSLSASVSASPVQLARLDDAVVQFQDTLHARGPSAAPLVRAHSMDSPLESASGVAPSFRASELTGSLQADAVQLSALDSALLQFRAAVESREPKSPQQLADQGRAAAASSLPHLSTIQRAFGTHDVTGVQSHSGAAADEACTALGARAYASGTSVVFSANNDDLHTAAHEAAHVVQQRQGVSLKGGVGAKGDVYERHADAVADAVVEGRSAQSLLDKGPLGTAGASGGGAAVQCATEGWGKPKFTRSDAANSDLNDKATNVDAKGGLKADADPASAVRRIPLSNVEGVHSGQVIVIVPHAQVLASNMSLDVVFHYHGGGKQSDAASKDLKARKQAIGFDVKDQKDGSVRTNDVHVTQIPQQLASSGEAVLTVLIQRAGKSLDVSNSPGQLDIQVATTHILEHLKTQGLLSPDHGAGRRYLSGHSQGGVAARNEAGDPSNTGENEVDGLFLFDGQGGKLGGVGIEALLVKRLGQDYQALTKLPNEADQLSYVKNQAFTFRGYTTAQGVFKRELAKIKRTVDQWFEKVREPKLASDVKVALRGRYVFQDGDRTTHHNGAVSTGAAPANKVWKPDYKPGSGNFEDALENR